MTPLELAGWLEFNVWRTGLKAHRFSSGSSDGAEVRAVLYADRFGRLKLPPNNAYLPVTFHSTRQRASGRTADWLRLAPPLVDEMKARGIRNPINLPGEVDDIRPWRWRGFLIGVGYSYHLDFPFDEALMDGELKRTCNRAAMLGMTAERVSEVDHLIVCLSETGARKGFAPEINARELSEARGLLGPEHLRMYACFDREGGLASACAVIHAAGTRAVGWLLGTRTGSLAPGAGHLLWRFVFQDLSSSGATGIDFGATDNQAVAAFKSRWGSRLVPTYNVRTYSVRALARFVAGWVGTHEVSDDRTMPVGSTRLSTRIPQVRRK